MYRTMRNRKDDDPVFCGKILEASSTLAWGQPELLSTYLDTMAL